MVRSPPSQRSGDASVEDRSGRSLQVQAWACVPAILRIPAVQPTVAFRPIEASKATVRYVRSTCAP